MLLRCTICTHEISSNIWALCSETCRNMPRPESCQRKLKTSQSKAFAPRQVVATESFGSQHFVTTTHRLLALQSGRLCSWTTVDGHGVSCQFQSFFRVQLGVWLGRVREGGRRGGGEIRSIPLATLLNTLFTAFLLLYTTYCIRILMLLEQDTRSQVSRTGPKYVFCLSPSHIAQGCLMFLEQDTQAQALVPWRTYPKHWYSHLFCLSVQRKHKDVQGQRF